MEGIRQIRVRRAEADLWWALGRCHSVRSYEHHGAVQDHFCVSSGRAELTIVLGGELVVELGPARRQLTLRPGSLGLVLPGTPHRVHAARGSSFVVLDVPDSRRGAVAIADGGAALAQREALLHALWEHPADVADGACNRDVDWALAAVARAPLIRLDRAHDTARAMAVKAYLDENYMMPISIGEVARIHRLDRFYLTRSFKKNFGVTPMSYVQFLRFEQFAWSSMTRGDARTFTGLSLEAGFGDYPTFSRRMRALLGRPPSRIFAAG